MADTEELSFLSTPPAPMLPISVQYPTHDPSLAEYLARIRRNQSETFITIDIAIPRNGSRRDAADEDLNTNSPPTEIPVSPAFASFWATCVKNLKWIGRRVFGRFESPASENDVELTSITTDNPDDDPGVEQGFIDHIGENLLESTIIGDEELAEHNPPPGFESPYNQNQIELTSPTVDIIDDDPSRDEQHTTRVHDYSDPEDVKFFLHLYEALLVLIVLEFIPEKHNPLAELFLKISVTFFAMAFIIHTILCWIYDRLENSNSSHQNLSSSRYKILKYVYYIFCILALLLLLPVFLISSPNFHPKSQPSSPPSPPLGA